MVEGEVSQITPEENSPAASLPVEVDPQKAYVERRAAHERIDEASEKDLPQKGFELGVKGPTASIRETLKNEWDKEHPGIASAAKEFIESQRTEVAGPAVSGEAVKEYQEGIEVAKARAEAIRLVEAAKPPLRERAAEAGKKKAGEIAEAGRAGAAEVARFTREKAPVVRAEAQKAAEKFSLVVEDVIVRATPKMEALIERGKKVLGKVKETDPRVALEALIDLPANFTEMVARYVEDVANQRALKARILEAKSVQREKEHKEKVKDFKTEMATLKTDWEDKKTAHQEKQAAEAAQLNTEVKARQKRINDRYSSYKEFPKIAEKRQKELAELKSWLSEREAQLEVRWEAVLAEEDKRFAEKEERLRAKYSRRIEGAIERAKKAETRAAKAKEEANVVGGFADTWRARATRMRRGADWVAALIGA